MIVLYDIYGIFRKILRGVVKNEYKIMVEIYDNDFFG